jgi:hypothetical protein
MKTTIEIEQFDNGKTYKVTTELEKDHVENAAIVALSHNENEKLGELILGDVKAFCDRETSNKVRLVIGYEKTE